MRQAVIKILIAVIVLVAGWFTFWGSNIINQLSSSSKSSSGEIEDTHLVQVNDVVYRDGYVYVAGQMDGLNVYKIDAGRMRFQVTAHDSSDYPQLVRTEGNRLFLGTVPGVALFDLSNPADPKYLSSSTFTYRTPGPPGTDKLSADNSFEVSQNIIAIAGLFGEIQFARITNDKPAEVLSDLRYKEGPGDWIKKIIISGQYAYLINDLQKVLTIDIHDPAQPKQIAELSLPGAGQVLYQFNSYTLLQSSNTLFATYTAGEKNVDTKSFVVAISISNPSAPVIVGKFEVPSVAEKFALHNNRLYLIYKNGPQTDKDSTPLRNGVMVLDISNPSAISKVKEYHLKGSDPIENLVVTDENLILFRGGYNSGTYQFLPL